MEYRIRDGVRLCYDEDGTGDPPVLLVHGWCCDHTYFAPQFEHFRREHRTVAVDLRGHGQSDKPEQDYTIAGFADDLAWLCRELGLSKPVVIGHSMGGVIAVELARRHADLPAAVVALDAPLAPPPGRRERSLRLIEALRGPHYREAQREFVAQVLFLSTDDAQRKARIVDAMSSAPQHVMAGAYAARYAWDGETALKACRVPLLSIAAAVPLTDPARLRELCPHAVTGQTVGAGHFLQLEVPEQVNAMIDRFLRIALPSTVGTR
jgi:pimeloyl-ACP methyl ester carboxylesterase